MINLLDYTDKACHNKVMKHTKSQAKIDKAKELEELVRMRKKFERAERELKDFFKNEIGDSGGIVAGDVVIVVAEKERRSVNKELLVLEHGKDFVKNYERVTQYKQLEIKKVKS